MEVLWSVDTMVARQVYRMRPLVLIAEDNWLQRRNLEEFFLELDGHIRLVLAPNGGSALAQIERERFDLALLDVNLGDANGVSLGERLHELNPECRIIFITSYPEYMAEALHRAHCYDYLIKPVKRETFQQLVRPLLVQAGSGWDQFQDQPFLTVDTVEGDRLRLPHAEIFFAEAQSGLVLIHTTAGQVRARLTLKELEDRCGGAGFCRCHGSYLVNVSRVARLARNTPYSDDVFFLGYRGVAQASARRRAALRRLLQCRS